ncbi:MAG: hypothetical protein JNJ60_22775 [Rhodocyclaceae bacterium]|nr:hypothetical protein [Rhodocyclaceae bacterium]
MHLDVTSLCRQFPSNFLDGGTRPSMASVEPATCQYDGSYYELRKRDGSVPRFDAAPAATLVRIRGGCLYFLTEMRDPQGRYLRIVRGGDDKGKIIDDALRISCFFTAAHFPPSPLISG